jgi:hypothetical protein
MLAHRFRFGNQGFSDLLPLAKFHDELAVLPNTQSASLFERLTHIAMLARYLGVLHQKRGYGNLQS